MNADVIQGTDAFLKYGLGLSDNVLKSKEFKKGLADLKGQLSTGTIEVEEYEARLAKLANASSLAAGEGKVLTQEQKAQAEEINKSLSAYAEQELGFSKAAVASREFQLRLKSASELQAQGKATSEEATEALRKWADQVRSSSSATEESAPGVVRMQQSYSDFAQTFSGDMANLLHAGEGFLLSEEERSAEIEKINNDTKSGISSALNEMWDTRQEFDGLFQEAAQKDLDAKTAAQGEVAKGQDAHNKKMADLQAKLGGADGANRANIEQQLGEERSRWNAVVSIANNGSTDAVQEVQDRYDQEREAIRGSLAQTVVDHTLSMVLMGEVSAETANGIFGALSAAYPDAEIITPVEQATVQVFDTLHQVIEGDLDPSGLVEVIGTAEASLVELDDQNRVTLGLTEEVWEGMGVAAMAGGENIIVSSDGAATGVEESAGRMSGAESTATGLIGTELATRQGDYEDTSAAASGHADDVTSAGQDAATGLSNASGDMASTLGKQQEDFRKAGTTGKLAAGDIAKGWSEVPNTVAKSGDAATRSLDDMSLSALQSGQSIADLNSIAAEAGDGTSSALGEGADAAKDAASDLEDTTDTVIDLGSAIDDLPDELSFDGDDALSLIDDLDQRLDDLRSNAEQGFVIRGRYQGKGPASASSPFVLFRMIDDLRANADRGFSIAGSINDHSQGLLNRSGDGELEYQRLLRRLSDADYEVVVRSRLDASDLVSAIAPAVSEARRLFDALNEGHSKFFDSSAAEEGSLASILAGDGDLDAIGTLGPQIEDLRGFLESLPSMAHLLANPEGRAEIESMLEEQALLWDRFIEDLKRAEDDRHTTMMKNIGVESDRGEQASDDALDRIQRLLDERRSGTGPQGDKPIELEDFSGEIQLVADMFKELGLITNATKPDLEAFYSEMTNGVSTSIGNSEALIDVIELMKEQWLEGTSDQADAEKDRHDGVMQDIDDQADGIDRLFEDWERGIDDVAAAEDALADRRKEFLSELKAERKEAESREKDVHDGVLDRLDEMEEREEDAHDARMDRLDAREEREDERHQSEVDNFEAMVAKEHEGLDRLEAELTELEKQKVDRELAEIGSGVGLDLAEAESALEGLNKALSEFDKRSEIQERKRRRPGSRGQDKVGLDPNARAGLQAALDSGELSEDAARRAALVLDGANLGAEQMRQLLEEAGLSLNDTLDARRDEIDLLDQQIARQQLLIDQETFRVDEAEAAIQLQIDAEDAKHQAKMDAIAGQRQAEEDAWDAFQERAEEARDAARDRHEEKMAQIEREFRARMIAEGFIEEAGRDPDEIAAEIAAIADKIFGPIRDFVRGGEESRPVSPGGGIGGTAPPIGIGDPGRPGIGGGGAIPGPIGPPSDAPPPGAPGAPAPVDPTLPPGGIELPPGILPSLSPGAAAAFIESLVMSDSAAGGFQLPPGAEAAIEAATISNHFHYIQNAPNQLINDGSDGAELLAAMYDLVGMMSP